MDENFKILLILNFLINCFKIKIFKQIKKNQNLLSLNQRNCINCVMAEGGPPPDRGCILCFSGPADDGYNPLLQPCNCHRDYGRYHWPCLVYWIETHYDRVCITCKHRFTDYRIERLLTTHPFAENMSIHFTRISEHPTAPLGFKNITTTVIRQIEQNDIAEGKAPPNYEVIWAYNPPIVPFDEFFSDDHCILCTYGPTMDETNPLIKPCACDYHLGLYHWRCLARFIEIVGDRCCAICRHRFIDPRIIRSVHRNAFSETFRHNTRLLDYPNEPKGFRDVNSTAVRQAELSVVGQGYVPSPKLNRVVVPSLPKTTYRDFLRPQLHSWFNEMRQPFNVSAPPHYDEAGLLEQLVNLRYDIQDGIYDIEHSPHWRDFRARVFELQSEPNFVAKDSDEAINWIRVTFNQHFLNHYNWLLNQRKALNELVVQMAPTLCQIRANIEFDPGANTNTKSAQSEAIYAKNRIDIVLFVLNQARIISGLNQD